MIGLTSSPFPVKKSNWSPFNLLGIRSQKINGSQDLKRTLHGWLNFSINYSHDNQGIERQSDSYMYIQGFVFYPACTCMALKYTQTWVSGEIFNNRRSDLGALDEGIFSMLSLQWDKERDVKFPKSWGDRGNAQSHLSQASKDLRPPGTGFTKRSYRQVFY